MTLPFWCNDMALTVMTLEQFGARDNTHWCYGKRLSTVIVGANSIFMQATSL